MSICTLSEREKYDLRRGSFAEGWDHFLSGSPPQEDHAGHQVHGVRDQVDVRHVPRERRAGERGSRVAGGFPLPRGAPAGGGAGDSRAAPRRLRVLRGGIGACGADGLRSSPSGRTRPRNGRTSAAGKRLLPVLNDGPDARAAAPRAAGRTGPSRGAVKALPTMTPATETTDEQRDTAGPQDKKRVYQKPELIQVPLRPEEAVLGFCKTHRQRPAPGTRSCSPGRAAAAWAPERAAGRLPAARGTHGQARHARLGHR